MYSVHMHNHTDIHVYIYYKPVVINILFFKTNPGIFYLYNVLYFEWYMHIYI